MQEAASIAIDLPQKALIYEDEEKTILLMNDPFRLAKRHGMEKDNKVMGHSKAVALDTYVKKAQDE